MPRELIEPHKGDKRYVRRDEEGKFKESDDVSLQPVCRPTAESKDNFQEGRRRQGRSQVIMVGKRVQFDDETWRALDLLAQDKMSTFQELADEAFRDLLRKHGIPASLREALSRSAGKNGGNVTPFKRKTKSKRKAKT